MNLVCPYNIVTIGNSRNAYSHVERIASSALKNTYVICIGIARSCNIIEAITQSAKNTVINYSYIPVYLRVCV